MPCALKGPRPAGPSSSNERSNAAVRPGVTGATVRSMFVAVWTRTRPGKATPSSSRKRPSFRTSVSTVTGGGLAGGVRAAEGVALETASRGPGASFRTTSGFSRKSRVTTSFFENSGRSARRTETRATARSTGKPGDREIERPSASTRRPVAIPHEIRPSAAFPPVAFSISATISPRYRSRSKRRGRPKTTATATTTSRPRARASFRWRRPCAGASSPVMRLESGTTPL